MKKMFALASLVLILMVASGCTANQMARNYGGTVNVDLPAGQKLINATWKEGNLWYLTRARREGEKPEVMYFKEDSNFGIMQGTVVFKEH
jgi:hypothetical protein